MTTLGWFLFGFSLGVFAALYHQSDEPRPEPAIELTEAQASWTGSDGPRWAFA